MACFFSGQPEPLTHTCMQILYTSIHTSIHIQIYMHAHSYTYIHLYPCRWGSIFWNSQVFPLPHTCIYSHTCDTYIHPSTVFCTHLTRIHIITHKYIHLYTSRQVSIFLMARECFVCWAAYTYILISTFLYIHISIHIQIGFYLLDGPRVSFIDFVCWAAYKYVGWVPAYMCIYTYMYARIYIRIYIYIYI